MLGAWRTHGRKGTDATATEAGEKKGRGLGFNWGSSDWIGKSFEEVGAEKKEGRAPRQQSNN